MKIKWKVSPAPTGQYASFRKRFWPDAEYEDGSFAGSIACDEEYCPSQIKSGKKYELRLSFADYSKRNHTWERKTFKKRFSTIRECKNVLKEYLLTHPEVMPSRQDS